MKKHWITILLLILFCHPLIAQISSKITDDGIILANSQIKKNIACSPKGPSAIKVASLYDVNKQEELLAKTKNPVWFEFVIGKEIVKNTDKYWQFKKISERALKNGGLEYNLTFEGMKGPVEGLALVVSQQLFPNSTLVREKLSLESRDKTFELNTINEKIHFYFPVYTFKKGKGKITSKEINIAKWGGEVLEKMDCRAEDRRHLDGANYFNLSQAHMFHPDITEKALGQGARYEMKGPFGIFKNHEFSVITAYEHASQDNLADPGIVKSLEKNFTTASKYIIDQKQGVEYHESINILNQQLHFLSVFQENTEEGIRQGVKIERGGYINGEKISPSKPYRTVWAATGHIHGPNADKTSAFMHDYLLKWICEWPHTREQHFYYNTWGMQRSLPPDQLWESLTYERIFQEIRDAAQLGVDIFVLDDGWDETQGIWKPHPERLNRGLKPIYDSLQKHGMIMGIWLSPLGIDKETNRFENHPEWVIRDKEGQAVPAQWGYPAFDFVSGFYDLFIEDCKWLIDQGARFFKWDAINTFYPYLPGLGHGGEDAGRQEVIDRYGYLLPIYVKNAMIELMEYKPGVVIEIDLTEDRRALPGLAMISAGKLFWMNNGASGYNDYSHYRAKSTRTIANEFNDIIPLQLFTYANYPHNSWPFFAQRYNMNTSLVAGLGFWGNLEEMNAQQRTRISKTVDKAKRVLPYTRYTRTRVTGMIGASPEIYTTVNTEKAAGQVIAFSGSATKYQHEVEVAQDSLLGVLNHAFKLHGNKLRFNFLFPMPDASFEAFIVPNSGTGISVVESTCWLDDITLEQNKLTVVAGQAGQVVVKWPSHLAKPRIQGKGLSTEVVKEKGFFLLKLEIDTPGQEVIIQ